MRAALSSSSATITAQSSRGHLTQDDLSLEPNLSLTWETQQPVDDNHTTRSVTERRSAYTKLTALCKSDPAVASLPKSADTIFFVFMPPNISVNIVGGKARYRWLSEKHLLDTRSTVYLMHIRSDDVDSVRDKFIAPVTRRFWKFGGRDSYRRNHIAQN